MKFWDASAVIPLCIDEPHTALMRNIAREDGGLVAWWGTPVECWSAFARSRRDGVLNTRDEDNLRGILAVLSSSWTEIRPSEEIKTIAGRLLLSRPLHAADSLQLAAALVWAAKSPAGHPFVCLDQRLRDAARNEGFTVLPKSLA